jgi:hypothetical protein
LFIHTKLPFSLDPDGHTADRSFYEKWVSENGTALFTRRPMAVSELRPNRKIKEISDGLSHDAREKIKAKLQQAKRDREAYDARQTIEEEEEEGLEGDGEKRKELTVFDKRAIDIAFVDAAGRGDLACMDYLLNAGATANSVKHDHEYQYNAIHMASKNGHGLALKKLIKLGADINAVNTEGSTPLMEAANSGKSECVEILVEKGANVNKQNKKGQTALMEAAMYGREGIANILLKADADADVLNKCHKTAANIAASNGHVHLKTRLQAHMRSHCSQQSTEYGPADHFPFGPGTPNPWFAGGSRFGRTQRGNHTVNRELSQETGQGQNTDATSEQQRTQTQTQPRSNIVRIGRFHRR